MSKLNTLTQKGSRQNVLKDYQICFGSRTASLIGRKEVLTGKAKFGIFGDGKEVAQVALAKSLKKGDWRSGYYRDQTLMFALGLLSYEEYFAQLYADANLSREPASAGRQMNSHFATRYIDTDGHWISQLESVHSSSDISPTAGQMCRSLGLAYASKLYRHFSVKDAMTHEGNEVSVVTIGNASTSEGVFFETVNAAGVLQVPLVICIWDDGYGISVPNKYHTVKQSISEVLSGFATTTKSDNGIYLAELKGWDYNSLCEGFSKAVTCSRKNHRPAILHITEISQPQGHSTSGSHERYKSKAQLEYEKSIDCLTKMRDWIIKQGVASKQEIETLEQEAEATVKNAQKSAWKHYLNELDEERQSALGIIRSTFPDLNSQPEIERLTKQLETSPIPLRRHILSTLKQIKLSLQANQATADMSALESFIQEFQAKSQEKYSKHLYSENKSPTSVNPVPAKYEPKTQVDGRQVIQSYFDEKMSQDQRIFIIGEDVGQLGGVNLEFEGLQDKFGVERVTDTGIREATILGQGIGSAMRGMRPIVDIQYLDYLLYCLQTLSDDLATLHYRTFGGQSAPVIIRTKGHRLEGIWHTGSPIGMILSAARGLHVCVPRNMTQAAGMYNTLLEGDDPALVIEVLNGYRLKEDLPTNLAEFKVAIGLPEVLREGTDVTIVTYGACVRIALEAANQLELMGIQAEIVDCQTLLPFDTSGVIVDSIRKTNSVLFLDEDVNGGATAYMMQKALIEQNAYDYLDTKPRTLSGKPHRGAYGSDGDYFCKPNTELVLEEVIAILEERKG